MMMILLFDKCNQRHLFVHLFCDQVLHWLPTIVIINLFATSICEWG